MKNRINLSHYLLSIVFCALIFIACKKEEDKVYEIDQFTAVQSGGEGGILSGKQKVKTTDQYISVLYSNIFKRGIAVADLNEARDAIYSVGDKQLAYEILVVNYLLRPDAELPSDAFVLQYPDSFLTEVYNTYLVRDISEVERKFLTDYINNNRPEVGAKEVIAAIALCNEFRIY